MKVSLIATLIYKNNRVSNSVPTLNMMPAMVVPVLYAFGGLNPFSVNRAFLQ